MVKTWVRLMCYMSCCNNVILSFSFQVSFTYYPHKFRVKINKSVKPNVRDQMNAILKHQWYFFRHPDGIPTSTKGIVSACSTSIANPFCKVMSELWRAFDPPFAYNTVQTFVLKFTFQEEPNSAPPH